MSEYIWGLNAKLKEKAFAGSRLVWQISGYLAESGKEIGLFLFFT
jgi:hypothetical protein